MKNPHRFIKVTPLFSAFVFVLTIGDYLAFHDISHDYVSKRVLESQGATFSEELPQWTDTSEE